MKKLLTATAATALLASGAFAEEIKLGVILGFTGPIESLTPHMAAGAELAMAEVTESGKLLGGAKVSAVRGDSTCIDAGAATAAAERLITSDGVKGIMGADCLWRYRRDPVQRCSGKRCCHDLAFRDIPSTVHRRRQRPVLPYRTF